jgi:hypothetical protein
MKTPWLLSLGKIPSMSFVVPVAGSSMAVVKIAKNL